MLRQVSKQSSSLLRTALRLSSSHVASSNAPLTLALPQGCQIRAKSTALPTIDGAAAVTGASHNAMPESLLYNQQSFAFPFQPAVYDVPGRHHYGKEVSAWMYKELSELLSSGSLDYDMITDMITILSERNYYREAMEALQFSRQNNIKPRITAYSRIISSCYHHERYELALQVFDVMRRDGFVASFVTYSRALSSATKANQHELALQLFRDLMADCVDLSLESQSIACNNILNSCARHDDLDTATWLVSEMKARGIPLTHVSYNSFVLCIAKCGSMVELKHILDEMSEAGLFLSSAGYLSAITACARWKKWEQVIKLYDEMLQVHGTSFVVSIAAAMMAHVKVGQPQTTIQMYNDSLANNVELNTFAKQAAVTAFLNVGAYDQALALCEEMLSGVVRTDEFFGLVHKLKVQALIAMGRIDEGLALFDETKESMDKTVYCYRMLISHYAQQRQYDEANKYCKRLFDENQYVASSDWIQALSIAIALPDKSSYWEFRRALEVRGPDVLSSIPEGLFLESSKNGCAVSKSNNTAPKKLLASTQSSRASAPLPRRLQTEPMPKTPAKMLLASTKSSSMSTSSTTKSSPPKGKSFKLL
ncbi:hypothetical protein AeMF1_015614 [Aphanomyces euteiches]|nr:hypothetical protein AeMF1_015614 [Aphanomyces euteiches]KAH9194994.1 hypothetical protein AeNC1_003027 [Aphanomyces euteiches]